MDSFELNKILGAILGTLLFVMGVGFIAEEVYYPSATGPGYALPEPEGGGGTGGEEEAPRVSIATLLASADIGVGEEQARKCSACHDMTAANTNKTGPGLYDIVDRLIGGHEGFAYSPVMADHAAAGDLWTYEALDAFLLSPRGFAPGTKMTFAGVRNDSERANIIAFLSTLSASPVPFPAPEADEPATDPPEAADTPAEVPSGSDATVEATTSVEPEQAIETPAGTDTSAPDAPASGATTGAPVEITEPSAEAPAAQ